MYRVKNGDTISDIYSFTSGNNDGSYEFAFVGDPQIGAGSTDSDIEGWNETLKTISSKFNADFLLSGGDQVNTASNETQYTGYINELFTSLPSATTIGNHDSGSAALISILTCQTKALTKDRQLPEATTGLFTKIHFSLI